MRKQIIIIALSLITLSLPAQDIEYVRQFMKKFSSQEFAGRAYAKNGDKKAAEFVLEQCKNAGIEAEEQEVVFPVNVFPSAMKIKSGKKTLVPGVDYVVSGSCPTVKGKFKVAWINKKVAEYGNALQNMLSHDLRNYFLIIDTTGIQEEVILDMIQFIKEKNPKNAKGIIEITSKNLVFAPKPQQNHFAFIKVKKGAISPEEESIRINIKAKKNFHYKSQNIMAVVPGKVDTFIVLSAHYDHCGMMGKKTYFPGGNDNASGSAMVMDFARTYSALKQKPYYSYAFIWFTGEESGLLGSKHFTENPLIALDQIKYLFNLDMVGSGDKGFAIVNGKDYPLVSERLKTMNDTLGLLPKVKVRKNAPNSDHYHFAEKNVKAFFIYTMGEYKEYHNINDKAEDVPLSKYNELFTLLRSFFEEVELTRI